MNVFKFKSIKFFLWILNKIIKFNNKLPVRICGPTTSSKTTHTYLAKRLTMIIKVVPPGRDLSIALRLG